VGASPSLCAPETLGIGVGRPIAAARREQAAGGGGEWRRQCSGGRERRGRGWEALERCGEARGRVNWGRGGSGRGAPRRAGGGGGWRSPAVALWPKFDGV
jgi:hypothetical protein